MREDSPQLRADFENSIAQCKKYDYVPGYFIRMLGERGAVGAATDLLDSPQPSEGFIKLFLLSKKHGKQIVDLTVEAIVLRQEHRRHFSEKQLDTATARLRLFE